MAPTSIDQLTVTAQALLDTCVVILNTTPDGAPASQFLTPSTPAIDCEFVAVQVGGLAEANTEPLFPSLGPAGRNRFGNVIFASYLIYVVRCGPEWNGVNPPTDADKTANAAMVQRDGWALWNGIRDTQDLLFDDCIGVLFDGGAPLPEQGNFVGWLFQIRASIEGYSP